MRIGSGQFRGRILRTPKGDATRPTSGMVRETLLNIIAPQIEDAHILDLFAGCGSVGLEALSRGAARATFVENARPALDCLHGNIAILGVAETTAVLPYPVDRALEHVAKVGEQFEIIFLDPPFRDVDAYLKVLDQVSASAVLAPDGVLVAQHYRRVKLPETIGTLVQFRLREIGDNVLTFYRQEK